ncbi:thioredoxin h, related [Neospora caninum Liverpool]|uniref:Thioredoxin n=1 Tax=Neospora caninum (strain Liverpool) TaxID=572307 RepID=F0V799_NEOCL|nr:thioredoxin h, related [Neospora caninum Liverpool]CBZ49590.1 thioredoxin h, related [Neospora caninum Liverpool]CEL64170.1 TPA: Thioredoxin h, related [Neospora caninum Liverpool]|eukprot:XP_003879625.1 thioredoxin h, related [Neospora caninum Liverpool]
MPIEHITTEAQYKSLVEDNEIVLVDFYAVWCGPCRQIAPVVESMSAKPEYAKVKFAKVDVDELAEIAEREDVNAMPTFKLYKQGKAVDTVLGANVERIEEMLKQHL